MTTNNFVLTLNYTEVADGASLITLAGGDFARLHIKPGVGIPADNVAFHPLILEKGTDRGFPYGGTEKVFARKTSKDSQIEVKLAVTPAI